MHAYSYSLLLMGTVIKVNFKTGEREVPEEKVVDYVVHKDNGTFLVAKGTESFTIDKTDLAAIGSYLSEGVSLCEGSEVPTLMSQEFYMRTFSDDK